MPSDEGSRIVERVEHSCVGVLLPLCTALPLAGSARDDSSPVLIPCALPSLINMVSQMDAGRIGQWL